MHRFYLPPEQAAGPALTLTGHEAHHGLHVLRLRRGETVIVLDGVGAHLVCEVQDCGRDQLRLRVLERQPARPRRCEVTLLQAVPKGKTIETIIQKATELGVARIVPLLADRVVAHLDDEVAAAKVLKWQAVAVEAIKQCGSPWLPKVEAPVTPRDFINRAPQVELALVASLQQEARHPRQYFGAFETAHRRLPASVSIWVGPEGDFSPAELQLIQSAGARPITLGPLVLRTDTAALYCLSVINYELESPTENRVFPAPAP